MVELQKKYQIGVRRFGVINWTGFKTLWLKECQRFIIVWAQTLLSPLVSSLLFLPQTVNSILITGGGYRNIHLMKRLKDRLQLKFLNEEQLGIDFDYIESELIAYLSARSIYNLPITFPSSTGVSIPSSGGKLYN